MTHAKRLDDASSKFFLVGFIAAKLQLLPVPVMPTIFSLLSSSSYLLGYALWLIACHFHPDHPPKKEAWYGFSQIKNQHRIASGVGFIGVSLCLLSFVFPVLLLPGVIAFATSNVVWSIAEYHKRNNPPADKSYSPERQNNYLSYAILSTLVGVIAATSLALVVIFPPIGAAALFISSVIGFSLTVAAFYFLLSTPKPKEDFSCSHHKINQQLSSSSLKNQPSHHLNQETLHQPLFKQEATRYRCRSNLDVPQNVHEIQHATQEGGYFTVL